MSENKNDELEIQGDGTENEAHIEYDIASYPSDFTLSGINDLWKNKDIVIPDFQRGEMISKMIGIAKTGNVGGTCKKTVTNS